MQNEHPPLTAYSEEQRQAAMIKYKVIAPYLLNKKTLTGGGPCSATQSRPWTGGPTTYHLVHQNEDSILAPFNELSIKSKRSLDTLQ
jgi:hypothetical protein